MRLENYNNNYNKLRINYKKIVIKINNNNKKT